MIELWTISATHTGDDYRGVSPTGKRTEYPGVDIFRVVDGKIVEQWGVFNLLSVLEQLGFTIVPPQEKQ